MLRVRPNRVRRGSRTIDFPSPAWRVSTPSGGSSSTKNARAVHYCSDETLVRDAAWILAPDSFEVVVASNLFGDILNGSRSSHPGRTGVMPPQPRSTPIAARLPWSSRSFVRRPISRTSASPVRSLRWSGAMMLELWARGHAAAEVMSAIASVTARGTGTITCTDRTETITQAVLAALS